MTIGAKDSRKRSTKAAYGSDVVVDMLQALDIEYVALNPGASYRGIHDSLVNYSGGRPEAVLCNHEGIAIAVAHGYAHAAGKPMAAAVHNVVGLLNASERIYNAWLDHAEVLIIGGTGPMASDLRRPGGDWIHTALVQGQAVREFTKFDDQPYSVPAIMDSMLRAYQMATLEPKGPVYVCFDAELQEAPLGTPVEIPDPGVFPCPASPQANPEALRKAVDLLIGASHPVIVADYIGHQPTVDAFVDLAEMLGAAVIDQGDLFNFPSRHPLNLSGAAQEALGEADVVLGLNVVDLEQAFTRTDRRTRSPVPVFSAETKVIDISLRHYGLKSWGQSYGKMYPAAVPISADVKVILPTFTDLVRERMTEEGRRGAAARSARLRERHEAAAERYAKQAASQDDVITQAFLAQQTWEIIREHDWALLDRDLRGGWARRLWDIKEQRQYFGTSKAGIGGALGRAVGAAIANRGTGRLNIHFQPDGDLLFSPGTLWTLANQRLPVLVVMHNNRSYNNDYLHQTEVALHRERPKANAGVGVHITDPNVDFATVARGFGVHAEGPTERPEELRPALERALQVVLSGKPALVDVVTPEF